MNDFIIVIVCLLFFVMVFSVIGGFDMVGVYIPPLNQAYMHGYIDLETMSFVPLEVDGAIGTAVLKDRLTCYQFSVDLSLDIPVELSVIYYDADGNPFAITTGITDALVMSYKDMPLDCTAIRVQVARTDGKGFSDADLLTLPSKVQLRITDEPQSLLASWRDDIGSWWDRLWGEDPDERKYVFIEDWVEDAFDGVFGNDDSGSSDEPATRPLPEDETRAPIQLSA